MFKSEKGDTYINYNFSCINICSDYYKSFGWRKWFD